MNKLSLFVALLFSTFSFSSHAFTIVLTDNSRTESQAAPTFSGGRAVFRLKVGTLTSLPETRIDKALTDAANVILVQPSLPPAPVVAKAPVLPAGGKGKATFSDADLPKRPPEEIARDEQSRQEAVRQQHEQNQGFSVGQHDRDMSRSDSEAMYRGIERDAERRQEAREEAERARQKAEDDKNWGYNKK